MSRAQRNDVLTHRACWLRPSAHRLLVVLPLGPDLARLGSGVRLVALSLAAHAESCGSHVACAGRASLGPGEAQEGFVRLEAALPSRLDDQVWLEDRRSSVNAGSGRVVIGMDPHKRSATIEVMTAEETIVGGGRFATDREGYAGMRRYAGQWPDRVWAIEGCAGIGKHIAVRLLADGEEVIDVPPKLSARARVFATGQGRKTDATDAHSVALVGTRMTGLRPVVNDEQLAVLRLLVDRHRSLGDEHTRKISQRSSRHGGTERLLCWP